jgi:hypothetical protein
MENLLPRPILNGDSPRKLSGPRPLSSPAQAVAPAETAEQLISLGWTLAGVLPNGKVVLQRGIRDSSEAGPVGFSPE